jgi:integrase/recombinase XerD
VQAPKKNRAIMTKSIVAAFKKYVAQIGYSKSSQYQIPTCITEFLAVINKNIEEINQQDILFFYDYLQTRPLKKRAGTLSEAMINHYLFALKTFFNWLQTTEQITQSPISNLKFKRLPSNYRQALSQQEIKQLFAAASTLKESTMLHLFYSLGLRRTEAENLHTLDIHFNKNMLYVRAGKGRKRRAIPMNDTVKNALLHYENTKENPSYNPAFMLNQRGNKMRGNNYYTQLKTLIKKIDNPSAAIENCTLHHLRHSIATHLLQNGMSIEFVRDFLGHTHLEATQIYTKVLLSNYEL